MSIYLDYALDTPCTIPTENNIWIIWMQGPEFISDLLLTCIMITSQLLSNDII